MSNCMRCGHAAGTSLLCMACANMAGQISANIKPTSQLDRIEQKLDRLLNGNNSWEARGVGKIEGFAGKRD